MKLTRKIALLYALYSSLLSNNALSATPTKNKFVPVVPPYDIGLTTSIGLERFSIEQSYTNSYAYLQDSPFARIGFLFKGKTVHDLIMSEQFAAKSKVLKVGQPKVIQETVFFNRNSKKLVVITPGLTLTWLWIVSLVQLFNETDVLMLNYRGHGSTGLPADDKDFLAEPLDDNGNITTTLQNWGVTQPHKAITWGVHEPTDLAEVIAYYRNQKKLATGSDYEEVIGQGICYAAYVSARAQATIPHLFDKLILDGTCVHIGGIQRFHLRRLHGDIPRGTVVEKPLTDYIGSVKIPILFIHSIVDYLTPLNVFDELLKSVAAPKIILYTGQEHAYNHLREPKRYKFICDLFINNSFEQCVEILRSYQVESGPKSV